MTGELGQVWTQEADAAAATLDPRRRVALGVSFAAAAALVVLAGGGGDARAGSGDDVVEDGGEVGDVGGERRGHRGYRDLGEVNMFIYCILTFPFISMSYRRWPRMSCGRRLRLNDDGGHAAGARQ